ncbi:MAG: protein translocase SEC61 complex subunit gamma [Candidatus Aenigmatarchaeota archaeon]
MKLNMREKLKEYVRVIKLNKTPARENFLETLRICVLGISILGLIGFIFYIISMIFGL